MTINRAGWTLNGPGYVVRGRCIRAVIGLSAVAMMSMPALALQTVSLSFDTISLADPSDAHVYTPAERAAIKDQLEFIYLSDPADPSGGPFGIKFEIFDPLSPPIPFTTSIVKFNNGFMGGAAEKLDFRNTDDNDDVDINALGLLKAFDGTAKAGGGTWTLPELTSSESIAKASVNLAAHEIGHSLGLRHHDSFGPIGSGIAVSGSSYFPTYTGPSATNASVHVMGLASTVALNADTLLTQSWLSERSAMKLAFNEYAFKDPELGIDHMFPGEAQDVPLTPIMVPNTQLGPPDLYFPDPVDLTPVTSFAGFAGAIIGASLDVPFEDDYYAFDAPAGTIITIEVISKVIFDTDPTRLPNPVDMQVELVDSSLSPVPYPSTSPFTINDDQFEGTDSILIDVVIPADGTYFIEVTGSSKVGADVTGSYELYVMGFFPFPTPFLAGDLNEDGFVGIDDLNIVLANWNDAVTVGDLLLGDPNGDGFVGISDLNIVLGNWNAGEPPLGGAVIPEPTTLVMLGLVGMAGVLRRR